MTKQTLFEQAMVEELSNFYYWWEKANKSVLTGETCFFDVNILVKSAYHLDMLKETHAEEFEKCDFLELVKQARKNADERIKND